VSLSANGAQTASGASVLATTTNDGSAIAFLSDASDLVANDANAMQDAFVRVRGVPTGATFCFGDGSGSACPCGNASAIGAEAGCVNSLGTAGALRASGTPSVAADTVVLIGSGMTNGSALYFQGTNQLNGALGTGFGDGLRCAGGSVIRLGLVNNVSGASTYPSGGAPAISVQGAISAGVVRTYQVWYRNPAPFCTGATYNLTNGFAIAWNP
jgi:hypothetical protein